MASSSPFVMPLPAATDYTNLYAPPSVPVYGAGGGGMYSDPSWYSDPQIQSSLINTAGQIGSSLIQNRAQNNATRQQLMSTREGVKFLRNEAAKAEAAYEQEALARSLMIRELLSRYGVSVPEMEGY